MSWLERHDKVLTRLGYLWVITTALYFGGSVALR